MRAVALMLVLAVGPSPSPGGLLGGVVGDLLDILPSRPAVSQPASPAPAPTPARHAGGKSPGPVAPRSPSSERVVSTVPSSSAAPRADAPLPPAPASNVWVLAAVGLAGLLAGSSAYLLPRVRRRSGDSQGLGPAAISALRRIDRRLHGRSEDPGCT